MTVIEIIGTALLASVAISFAVAAMIRHGKDDRFPFDHFT